MLNIVGAGGFAREVLHYWTVQNDSLLRYREVGSFQVNFYVEKEFQVQTIVELEEKKDRFLHHNKMTFVVKPLEKGIKIGNAIVAVGDPYTRERLSRFVIRPQGFNYLNPEDNHFGIITCPGSFFTHNISVGHYFISNLNVTVGHDCQIGNFVTVSPGANISGNVTIGDRAYIGTGAVIREGINIGSDSIVGAGAVVVKDVAPGTVVVGNPAKYLKDNDYAK